jgi:hypothetical protein
VGSSRLIVALLFGLLAGLCAALPAAAHADLQTIDFDSAPPAIGAPLDGAGDISFPTQLGFRPYRFDVGLRAHSGTTVGNLGRCREEVEATGGEAGGCEFFQAGTTGVLARTAKSVTVFAGRFEPQGPEGEPEWAVLTAFAADGTQLATTGPVAIDANGFDQSLSVSDDTGRIARFTIAARIGPDAEGDRAMDLGIDDLAVNFAEGGEPDFALAHIPQVIAVIQGQSVDVPVQISRLNGSKGPIELSVSGLPSGVTAASVEVPGNQTTARITLTASQSAPSTDFLPIDATLEGDPLGDTNVGPSPRTTTLSVRVANDFRITVGDTAGGSTLTLAHCAPVNVPITITRDIALQQDIVLSARTLMPNPGLHAEFLPSPVVSPGSGDLIAHRVLRISAEASAILPETLAVESGVRNSPARRLNLLSLSPQAPSARVGGSRPGSGYGLTPRFLSNGTPVVIHGNGFCPGTVVEVGNEEAEVPATLLDDHTAVFEVPRYASSGPITIKPPGVKKTYETEDSLLVDDFRNTNGFRFFNYPVRGVSITELTEAFGADDLFVKINPCWPFGDCAILTPILNPVAAIEWGLLNAEFALPGSGHCFGMDQAVLKLTSGKVPYGRFQSASGHFPADNVHDLAGELGTFLHLPSPPDQLDSFLDAEQIRTNSEDLVSAWVSRPRSLQDQLTTLSEEFRHNRPTEMMLDDGGVSVHTVLAYDMKQTGPDTTDIYVSNSNRPFVPDEVSSNGTLHRELIDEDVIHVDRAQGRWSFKFSSGEVWSGRSDGTLWAIPKGTVPDDASLPGVQALGEAAAYLEFRSDGSVRAVANPGLALLALIADTPHPVGGSGTLVTRKEGRPLDATFEGVKDGDYNQAYIVPGFIASATDVKTAKGVRDRIHGVEHSITLASGRSRPLELELARRSSATAMTAATLETHASANGRDRAGLADDGAMTYAHDGAPTTLRFSLTAIRRDGGPATFISGPVPVGRGERLRVKPIDRELHRVRLEIRGANGRSRVRVLRNRGQANGQLKLSPPKLTGHRLSIRFHLRGVHGRAVVGATLRLMRNGRMVAHRAVALKTASGSRGIHWRLPGKVKAGHYRLLTDLHAIGSSAPGSTAAASIDVHRAAVLRVGR